MSTFECAIGPLLTNSGLHAWSLFLSRDLIVALKYGFADGLKLGLHLYAGFPADPGEPLRRHPASLTLASYLPMRHYPLTELQAITVVVSHGMNHVRLDKSSCEFDRYDIPKRGATGQMLATLRHMYPQLCRDSGIPTTGLGRVMKF